MVSVDGVVFDTERRQGSSWRERQKDRRRGSGKEVRCASEEDSESVREITGGMGDKRGASDPLESRRASDRMREERQRERGTREAWGRDGAA